ncbi:DedA family protein [Paenibacillus contaminans]|uniref:DedA family protein n=1 Tax=Paenibacillus contaminans TaxID=450362 RepID=A0A329MJ00_9BACL|nr:DedA family protein [Paenibacillus contaminans]RAV19326.1 DedA family protein [Paenibacillus contaminans]
METITHWFEQYGYGVLFFGLLLEYIALPFPGELVMGYSGYLVYNGQMSLILSLTLAWLGTSLGMTVTYVIGSKLGYPFFEKYGHRFLLSPRKLQQTSKWFEKYGSKLLFFAFFIPGVRHFTGYLSGILNIPFRTFALYCYTGALFWVLVFVVGGTMLGTKWEIIHDIAKQYAGVIIIALIALAAAWLLYRLLTVRDNRVVRIIRQRSRWFVHTKAGVRMLISLITLTSIVLSSIVILLLEFPKP